MPVGLFRGEEGWVQVDYGTGTTIPVPRSKYEANGYKPDFDKLPSEAEYRAAENKKYDDATALADKVIAAGAPDNLKKIAQDEKARAAKGKTQ